MDLAEDPSLLSCLFCAKNSTDCNYIAMATNSLQIASENIEYSSIVFKVVQRKLIENQLNMICDECNDMMIQFYIFKESAQKNSNLYVDEHKSEILKEVDSFLDEYEENENMTFKRYVDCLAIVSQSERKIMENSEIWQPKELPLNIIEQKNHQDQTDDCFVEIKKEKYTSDTEEEYDNYQFVDLKFEEEMNSEPKKRIGRPSKKHKSKIELSAEERQLRKEYRETITIKELIDTPDGEQFWLWSCAKCDYSSKSITNFKVHLVSSHSKDMKKECYKNETLSAVTNFESTVHHEPKMRVPRTKYSCYQCGLRMSGKRMHLNHETYHHLFDLIAPVYELHKCEDCRCLFVEEEQLAMHLLLHKQSSFQFETYPMIGSATKKCKISKFRPDDLEIDSETGWKCGHCERRFPDELESRKHVLIMHSSSFVCPIDNRSFIDHRPSAFIQHLTHSHPELFPDVIFVCLYCNLEFHTNYDKVIHMKTCNQRKYVCDYCGKNFFQKQIMTKHLRIHAGSLVYSCEICGKSASNSHDLQTHLRSHSTDTPFKCSLCPKSYKTSSARASHMQVHNESILECPYCDVKFKKRCVKNRHVKFYHDEKFRAERFSELTCGFCSKAFLQKYRYSDHMRKCHNVLVGSTSSSSGPFNKKNDFFE